MPLRSQLKLRTRVDHEALHDAPALLKLRSADLTAAHYAQVLAGFQAFYQWLEVGAHPDVADACAARLHALACDLAVLPPARPWEDALDEPRPATTPEAALGVRYVVEGSTLGGAVLAKEVRKRLGEDAPTAFYALPSARWRELLEELNNVPPTAAEEVVRAAVLTFAALRHLFTSHPKGRHRPSP